jgi:signal transduction histidine kinase
MKTLRRLILANTAVLFALGIGIGFNPPLRLPVTYAVGEPYQSLAQVHLLAMALAGLALVVLLQSRLSLTGDLRQLALALSLADALIALMAFIEQIAFDGSPAGWLLILPPLALAAALAWLARRPLRSTETAAEIAALKIPPEVRQALLQQIGEAAAQEERNRLARDLHDSIKQQLFSINVGAAAAQERWESDPEGARKALADVRRSAREAMVEMQAMLHQLRPEALGTAGLVEALREQCEALGYRTGAEVTLEIGEPLPDDRLPPGAQDALFRIGQEMLANVARHARAKHVQLWLGRQGEEVVLRVADDGQGFDPAAEVSGMGLRHLKERATSLRGRLEVVSAPGSGAGLTVRIPLVSSLPPAPVEEKRTVFAEFLALSVAAGCICSPLWTGSGAEGAVGALNAGDPAVSGLTSVRLGIAVTSVLLALAVASWFLLRSAPPRVKSFVSRKLEILGCLCMGWWWAQLAFDIQTHTKAPTRLIWGIVIACCLYAAGALVWVHRVGEVRRVWRPGIRFWLLPLLPVALVVAAAVDWIFERPGPLTLTAADAFFLAITLVFPYLIARQRRVEGEPV